MFRYRARRRRFARRVGRIARSATGIVLAKRILLHDFLIPDVSSVDFDNPVEFEIAGATATQAEEVESTGGTTLGTDVATVPLYSKLLSMRLNLMFRAANATMVRWMLVKNTDNDRTAAAFNTDFHSSNDSGDSREVRKLILSKGFVNIPSDKLAAPLRVRISRKALQRAAPMRDGDRLQFVLSKEAAGTTATLSGFGTMWFRANG